MSSVPNTKLSRYGGWLPSSAVHKTFIENHTNLVAKRLEDRTSHLHVPASDRLPGSAESLHVPSVQAFADAIHEDPVMSDLFDKIFLQASPLNQVMNFDKLLFILDVLILDVLISEPPPPPLLYHHQRERREDLRAYRGADIPLVWAPQ
ncbi:hypothetical protein PAXINDRAFT_11415 [Paxillus involutus ATCC 200175]|uniref:Uncharacterized protein n=1 Tax=Paxillus involutus ATCC 200175 TaxID=664439 RepID=A0A0C9U8X8_PAXIN|nr:hypothetical protein PAXINDRAFT_11415 [Paxillus involutus ATCC 200175]